MSSLTLSFLLTVVAFVGIVHTLTGPDHYVPFIAMARAGQWSKLRTILVTVFCGIGHVLGSIVLGAIGIALGWAISPLQSVEGVRGSIAGWLLIAFGLVYAVWGFRRASRGHKHTHWHTHGDGTAHTHEHDHRLDHAHAHGAESAKMTPWILFTILVFGPCEPLIPLLMLPAVQRSASSILIVSIVFAICTIATMTTIVMLALRGIQMIKLPWLERQSHTLAGSAIALCGLAIQFGL